KFPWEPAGGDKADAKFGKAEADTSSLAREIKVSLTKRAGCGKPAGKRQESEVLLVADVGNGALVLAILAARGKRILAAGDHVLGAHGELPAPRGAPGQAEPDAVEAALARGIRDLAHDAGAEVAVTAAPPQAAAGPAVRHAGRGLRIRDQPGLGHGARDGHVALVADVVLGEDGQVVAIHLAGGAAGTGSQPRRQVAVAVADGHPHAAAAMAEGGRGAAALRPAACVAVERGKHAVVGEVAQRRCKATLVVAQQGK